MEPTARPWPGPPRDLGDLRARAETLRGRTVAELESWLGLTADGPSVRRKGKTGQLIERALGGSGSSAPAPDFPELGVELKTIPLDAQGRPRESTFVCTMALATADACEWADSVVRAKLQHVLWIPLVEDGTARRVGAPLFWRPTSQQEAVLRADFDDIVGLVAIGRIEDLDARVGRWLQARPKAAHGRVRTRAYGPESELIETMPRGFYLRARFTQALLADPCTLHGAE